MTAVRGRRVLDLWPVCRDRIEQSEIIILRQRDITGEGAAHGVATLSAAAVPGNLGKCGLTAEFQNPQKAAPLLIVVIHRPEHGEVCLLDKIIRFKRRSGAAFLDGSQVAPRLHGDKPLDLLPELGDQAFITVPDMFRKFFV